jgi:hypothetical protein
MHNSLISREASSSAAISSTSAFSLISLRSIGLSVSAL